MMHGLTDAYFPKISASVRNVGYIVPTTLFSPREGIVMSVVSSYAGAPLRPR